MNTVQTNHSHISSLAPTVHALARKLSFGIVDAEEVGQTVLLRLLSKPHMVPREVSKGWLHAVVRNTIYDAHRHERFENKYIDRAVGLDISGSVCEHEDGEYPAVHRIDVKSSNDVEPDLLPKIKNVFRQLTKPLRQALVLYADGYSYADISKLTNTKIGTVRSRIHNARKKACVELADFR